MRRQQRNKYARLKNKAFKSLHKHVEGDFEPFLKDDRLQISEELKDHVRELNYLDERLHKAAIRIFDERAAERGGRARRGTPPAEVDALRSSGREIGGLRARANRPGRPEINRSIIRTNTDPDAPTARRMLAGRRFKTPPARFSPPTPSRTRWPPSFHSSSSVDALGATPRIGIAPRGS